ncbi:sodium-dependent nutrient amino acid transporter 1 [Folsomia candida]|uniref:sodium-dependent nutrient amino acid transporter 1 n=1 Tax=Folsomia candida TaxID=158441 RepID=UPI001604D749|nr:sodium-dependent nutrient amino acid transporter 1 [Folsomia candida]
MSVGLENIWRFPFIALTNGGGAFLIPYLIVLVIIGRPIYYLEMCLGQFTSCGLVRAWSVSPLFKGIGFAVVLASFCVGTYYCTIMAVAIYYLVASFSKTLPWDYCDKNWGGDLCTDDGKVNTNLTSQRTTSLYFHMEVFPQLPNVEDGLGKIHWKLALSLLLAWIPIFLTLWKGVKSSGKVAYFTALFPYVVLLILLIRGVTLEGAGTGIEFFFRPQWSALYDPEVWYAAVGPCFFSLGIGFGPILSLSSHNKFNHNVYRDTIIISFMDTFTSILAGCTVFAVLGYLSKQTGIDVDMITSGGMDLAFVAYPEAIANFGWAPQLFAVLFFLMLLTLGIGTLTGLTGSVIGVLCEQFRSVPQWIITLSVCAVGFLFGLMYCTEGGLTMIDLIDYFGSNFIIYVMGGLECAAIAWVYGLQRFCNDIEFMLERPVGWYWKICWGFVTPVGLAIIFVYAMVTQELKYPTAHLVAGWSLAAVALSLVPAFMLHTVYTRLPDGFLERMIRPKKEWGPLDNKIRLEWLANVPAKTKLF